MAELIIGEGAAHVPVTKVLVDQPRVIGGTTFNIKAGITSVGKERWRAWYAPILGEGDVTTLLAPPGGLNELRATMLAQAACNMQAIAIKACLEQVEHDEVKKLQAKAKIDEAISKVF